MAFHIRPATPADALSIARVQIASWQTTYAGLMPAVFLAGMPETLQARALGWQETAERLETPLLVAQDAAGEVFGFASGGPARKIPDFRGELYAIYLLSGHQRRGAGRALLTGIARELMRLGYTDMALWVLRDNPSRAFYEHLGAQYLTEQDYAVGGATVREYALGWRDLNALLNR